ncbi:hypothetical protein ACC761_39325, partial [Rhizobium ruizarguesonis]
MAGTIRSIAALRSPDLNLIGAHTGITIVQRSRCLHGADTLYLIGFLRSIDGFLGHFDKVPFQISHGLIQSCFLGGSDGTWI